MLGKIGIHEYTFPCCKLQTALLNIKPGEKRIEAERQCMGCKRKYNMVARVDGIAYVVEFQPPKPPKKLKKKKKK